MPIVAAARGIFSIRCQSRRWSSPPRLSSRRPRTPDMTVITSPCFLQIDGPQMSHAVVVSRSSRREHIQNAASSTSCIWLIWASETCDANDARSMLVYAGVCWMTNCHAHKLHSEFTQNSSGARFPFVPLFVARKPQKQSIVGSDVNHVPAECDSKAYVV